MAPPRVLLLGGHGKVSLLMTPKLLSKSWNVTSLIRNPEQKPAILDAGSKAGSSSSGKLDVLIASLGDVKSDEAAKKILDEVKPDWVVWSAGAGGKGGPETTNAIDKTACIHFIRSSISTPSITKFLVVSALSSRRSRASWHDEDDYALVNKMNTELMPVYYKAKLASDEVLTVSGRERKGFGYISLRPGQLSDEPETGKIQLGKTKAKGSVSRQDVAEVAVRLLEQEGVKGWFDLLNGEEPIGDAVKRVLEEKIDSMEGEDFEAMRAEASKL